MYCQSDGANTQSKCNFRCLLCMSFVSAECGWWQLEAEFVVSCGVTLTRLDLNLTCDDCSVLP